MQSICVNPDALYSDEAVAMPLNKKDWDDIKRLVSNAAAKTEAVVVSPIVAASPTTTEENWFKRNSYWFAILAPTITVILFFVGLGLGWFNSVFDVRIAAKLNEANGTNASIQHLSGNIEQLSKDIATANGELKAIRTLWEGQLKKTSNLRQQEFKGMLPQTAEALAVAQTLNISSAPEVLTSMRQNFLSTDTGAPGYWLAASSFITYRSKQESGQSFEAQLPRCYDGPPAMRLKIGEQASIWTTPVEWKNCVLNLEDEMPQEWWDSLSGSKLYKERVIGADPVHILLLRNCLVRYQGGRISSRVFTVLGFTFFQNCQFEFSFSTAPPKEGGELSAFHHKYTNV